jgi:RNA polymerase-binding transcription factor DksA
MDKQVTGKYRERLLALAARMDGTVAELENSVRNPTGGQTGGGLSNAPLHLGDIASDVITQEIDATLLENEAYIRNEVSAALERTEHGKYGICERCGKTIIRERLDAIPYARYCTRCAEKLQTGRRVNLNEGRPEGWLGKPGHELANSAALPTSNGTSTRHSDDRHAAGTPGGGTSAGGLAGTNSATGDLDIQNLNKAMGNGNFDVEVEKEDMDEEHPEAYSGRAGGAVGGTPDNKRVRGGKTPRQAVPKATSKKGKKK